MMYDAGRAHYIHGKTIYLKDVGEVLQNRLLACMESDVPLLDDL